MRRFILFLSAFFILQACNDETSKPETINDVFEPTDEDLYAACADLQGIGQFVIGKTTFKQVLNDKDFKNVTTEFLRKSNLYNGHWGFDFWHSMYENSAKSTGKASWMENASKGKVKQLHTGITSKKIAGLEFDTFDMAFLNDTLVAIWFYPKREIANDVIGHYKEKYGDGRGHYKYHFSRFKKGDEYYGTKDLDERRSWENEEIALDYVNKEYYHSEPNQKATSSFKHTLLIYSKSCYPVFEETLKGLAEEYNRIQNKEKKTALDAL